MERRTNKRGSKNFCSFRLNHIRTLIFSLVPSWEVILYYLVSHIILWRCESILLFIIQKIHLQRFIQSCLLVFSESVNWLWLWFQNVFYSCPLLALYQYLRNRFIIAANHCGKIWKRNQKRPRCCAQQTTKLLCLFRFTVNRSTMSCKKSGMVTTKFAQQSGARNVSIY